MIVLPLFATIKEYLRKHGDRSPDIEVLCPCCGRRLRRHGRYFRRVVLGIKLYRIPIYRRFCPHCHRTTSLCPCFLRPYSQFALPVHEAAVRLLVQGRSPDAIAQRLCQGPQAGGISDRTIQRWQSRWKAGASDLLSALSERILSLSPGTDLTPFFPSTRMPRGSLRAIFGLGEFYRDLVWKPRRPPLFPFLRLSFPSQSSI
jgi:transposase-like protein